MFEKEVETDENGLNAKIQSHLLPEERMRDIGFTDRAEGRWFYGKGVKFPNKKQYKQFDISFCVTIPKDGGRLRIDVLDDAFLQPYDYQRILRKNSGFEPALIVMDFVEGQMEYLQKAGVISGHIYGEYI